MILRTLSVSGGSSMVASSRCWIRRAVKACTARVMHELGEIGFAKPWNEIQFSVRVQSGAPNAGQNIARIALGTFLDFADGAFAFLRPFAPFNEQDFEAGMFHQMIGRKELSQKPPPTIITSYVIFNLS